MSDKPTATQGETSPHTDSNKKAALQDSGDISASASIAARDFDLLTLKLFLAVVDEGNMMRAAEREHITVSAVSRRISALEARFGLKLLERNERGVTPTAAGMELAQGAKAALNSLGNLAINLNSHRIGASGLVRVHAHMSAMTPHLMQSLAAFRRQFPAVEILLVEETSVEVLTALNSDQADLGFISGTLDAAGLSVFHWMRDELVAILPTGHPLASRDRIQFKVLLDYPFVAMQRGSALVALFEQAARKLGRSLLPCAYLVNFESVRRMVEAGLGVGILPTTSAGEPHPGIIVRPLAETWAVREINICCRDRSRLSATTLKLLDHLVQEADKASGSR